MRTSNYIGHFVTHHWQIFSHYLLKFLKPFLNDQIFFSTWILFITPVAKWIFCDVIVRIIRQEYSRENVDLVQYEGYCSEYELYQLEAFIFSGRHTGRHLNFYFLSWGYLRWFRLFILFNDWMIYISAVCFQDVGIFRKVAPCQKSYFI